MKTKFGISYGLTGLICYLSGIVNIYLLTIVVGSVLYFENDDNLRFNALQAFVFTIGVNVITYVLFKVNILLVPEMLIAKLFEIFKVIVLIYGGIKAVHNIKVRLPLISDWIEKIEL